MSSKVVPITKEMMDELDVLLMDVVGEYIVARSKFGPFDNGHEGIGVMWEEFLELRAFVFGKDQTHEQCMNARRECIQIATMALCFASELLPRDK